MSQYNNIRERDVLSSDDTNTGCTVHDAFVRNRISRTCILKPCNILLSLSLMLWKKTDISFSVVQHDASLKLSDTRFFTFSHSLPYIYIHVYVYCIFSLVLSLLDEEWVGLNIFSDIRRLQTSFGQRSTNIYSMQVLNLPRTGDIELRGNISKIRSAEKS